MIKRFRIVGGIALAALAMVSVACGGDDENNEAPAGGGAAASLQQVPAPREAAPAGSKAFVGHDKANGASVGLLVLSDGTAAAYECDGNETWTWYTGAASGSDLNLVSADNKKLTAKIDGSVVTGTASNDFVLESASAGAGIFRQSFSKGSTTETHGWVIENDGTIRGGVGATVSGQNFRVGANFSPTQTANIEALPEFTEIKQAIPGFPAIPSDLTVFSAGGGMCTRLALKVIETNPGSSSNNPANTLGNRTRLGLMERLGCKQRGLFGEIT